MAKRRLGILLAVLLCGTWFATAGAAEANPYKDMIAAIEAWLQSNPVRGFSSAEDAQVFAWKVGLERLGYGARERFVFYREMLAEIGDGAFTYGNWVYSAPSIRAKMMETYPVLDYLLGDRQIPEPGPFFAEMYAWYQANTTTSEEQGYWLQLFLRFPSEYTLGPDLVASLMAENRSAMHEILVQYLGLAALYLADDSQIGYFEYIYSYGIGQDTRPPTVRADFMLGPLASFCEAAASFLTPEERAQMLAFVIPDYAQSDYAVRIYVALNP